MNVCICIPIDENTLSICAKSFGPPPSWADVEGLRKFFEVNCCVVEVRFLLFCEAGAGLKLEFGC